MQEVTKPIHPHPTRNDLHAGKEQLRVGVQYVILGVRGGRAGQQRPAGAVGQRLQDGQELGRAALKHVGQETLHGRAGPGQLKRIKGKRSSAYGVLTEEVE